MTVFKDVTQSHSQQKNTLNQSSLNFFISHLENNYLMTWRASQERWTLFHCFTFPSWTAELQPDLQPAYYTYLEYITYNGDHLCPIIVISWHRVHDGQDIIIIIWGPIYLNYRNKTNWSLLTVMCTELYLLSTWHTCGCVQANLKHCHPHQLPAHWARQLVIRPASSPAMTQLSKLAIELMQLQLCMLCLMYVMLEK